MKELQEDIQMIEQVKEIGTIQYLYTILILK